MVKKSVRISPSGPEDEKGLMTGKVKNKETKIGVHLVCVYSCPPTVYTQASLFLLLLIKHYCTPPKN